MCANLMFMDLADYQKHIAALPFGKRLPPALYSLRRRVGSLTH